MRTLTNTIFPTAIIVLLLSVYLSACVSRQIMYPEYLLADSTTHLRITTIDGTIVMFSPGRYTVRRSSDTIFVQGTGSRIRAGQNRPAERFDGVVRSTDIKELVIAETYIPAAFWYPAGVIIGGLLVFSLSIMSL